MGICRIQKPTSNTNSIAKHGKLYAQITCNDNIQDEFNFDATKGDLRLHLICEDDTGNAFYIGNIDDKLQEIKEKILVLETEQAKIKEQIELKDFENYIISNNIEV